MKPRERYVARVSPLVLCPKITFQPMFVLISDSVPDRDDPADDLHPGYIACQRNLIFEILSFGLPVALFNGLEFRDSKVWRCLCYGNVN